MLGIKRAGPQTRPLAPSGIRTLLSHASELPPDFGSARPFEPVNLPKAFRCQPMNLALQISTDMGQVRNAFRVYPPGTVANLQFGLTIPDKSPAR